MTLAERLVVRILSWHISRANALEARVVFDREYAGRPEQWRRDIWREAAERAERKRATHDRY